MASGGPQQAKRAFVKVLFTIAALYGCRVELTRESPDEALTKAFKRVALKARPDKGGLLKHAQALNAAKAPPWHACLSQTAVCVHFTNGCRARRRRCMHVFQKLEYVCTSRTRAERVERSEASEGRSESSEAERSEASEAPRRPCTHVSQKLC